MKTCKYCNKILDVSNFGKKKQANDNLQPYCKICIKLYNKDYKTKHKEDVSKSVRKYYYKNKDKILNYHKEYMKVPEHASKELERQRENNANVEH